MPDRLFEPLKLGNLDLKHRLIMAPLTRFRASDEHVQLPFTKQYYEQRACVPGTLLITEATFISPRACGYRNVPGLWNDEQLAAWKEVTDAVHAKGSYIYCQLWALGRVAVPKHIGAKGFPVVSSSAVPVDSDHAMPKEMTEDDIQQFIKDYATAAANAVHKAGFDGVEIHGANGYLIDQFWQDVVNIRTDKWGGSVENRAQFGLAVTKAVIEAIGDSKKVGIRLSPWSGFQGMGMADPVPQFSYIINELKSLDIAYVHLVESRIGTGSAATAEYEATTGKNDVFLKLWKHAPMLLAGGFTPEKSKVAVNETYKDNPLAIAIGRYWISTPDLAFRIQQGIELTPYDRDTFYKAKSEDGYTDYPFSKEFTQQSKL